MPVEVLIKQFTDYFESIKVFDWTIDNKIKEVIIQQNMYFPSTYLYLCLIVIETIMRI